MADDAQNPGAADPNAASKNDPKKKPTNPITLHIEPDQPLMITEANIKNMQNKAQFLSRNGDRGLVNESTGSSIAMRANGEINIASSKYAQYKMSPMGGATEIAIDSSTFANRRIVQADEIIINNHKLNPRLFEFGGDFKKIDLDYKDGAIVGNLNMIGSVLVKAWEPNLQRYMLIRRPAMMPIFGPTLNLPHINDNLGIDSSLKMDAELIGISSLGYQVNSLISDEKTLIGKEGKDRAGIDRTAAHSNGIIGGAVGNSFNRLNGAGNDVTNAGEVGKGKYTAAKIISGMTGIKTEFILAQMIHESGWSDSEAGSIYHNYGGLKDGDKGHGEWLGNDGSKFTIFESDQEYAECWVNDVVVIQEHQSELVACSQNGDLEGYFKIMRDNHYFSAPLKVYLSDVSKIYNTLCGEDI